MSQSKFIFPLEPALGALLAGIRASGGRPLLVGGCVRDALMGFKPKDIDIEVFGLDGESLKKALSRHGRVFAVGISFGVLKVRLPGLGEIDFSLPRRESRYETGQGKRGHLVAADPAMTPYEAAYRRDFTVNAMMYDPAGYELLDYFGGQRDLAGGILRHTSPAFAEDPLRVLRGMQFAARWDFRLAPETIEFCAGLRSAYPALARERVWGEWHKLAEKGQRPSSGLRVLAETGWRSLYPALENLDGPAWEKTLAAVDGIAAVCARKGLAGDARTILLLAALAWNMGPAAPGNEEGAQEAAQFLEQIGCPHHYSREILPLVRQRLAYLSNHSDPEVRRLSLRLAPATIRQWSWLLEAASPGELNPGKDWLEAASRLDCADGRLDPLVKGRHLKEAGLKPGRQYGKILAEALEAQLNGNITNSEEAARWLAARLGSNSS